MPVSGCQIKPIEASRLKSSEVHVSHSHLLLLSFCQKNRHFLFLINERWLSQGGFENPIFSMQGGCSNHRQHQQDHSWLIHIMISLCRMYSTGIYICLLPSIFCLSFFSLIILLLYPIFFLVVTSTHRWMTLKRDARCTDIICIYLNPIVLSQGQI